MKLANLPIIVALVACTGCSLNNDGTAEILSPTVEERRLDSAIAAMPQIGTDLAALDQTLQQLLLSNSYQQALRRVEAAGAALWLRWTQRVQSGDYDDRPLYWQRLYVNRAIRREDFSFEVSRAQRIELIERHETSSRGQNSITFSSADTVTRVLVSGFDPFLLDQNLKQVNPSGIVALALDNRALVADGRSIEIQTVMMPVRYKDFDDGELETWLAPVYEAGTADLVVTVSMGRGQFDLERFPGLRRSAAAPDNVNRMTGASAENPLVPMFPESFPPIAEFVEFSLPASAMTAVGGDYAVALNNAVTTLEAGKLTPDQLSELNGLTAVRGGGGGYLSNEISYRTINLRAHLRSSTPTGHIHTPRIADDNPDTIETIVEQTQALILRAALEDRKDRNTP